MYLKGIYAPKPALYKLFLLLLFMLMGAIFSSLLATGIFYGSYGLNADLMEHPNMVRLIQLFSTAGTFLFPAIALAWTGSPAPRRFLSLRPLPNTQLFLLTAVSVILLSPAISLTGLLNQQMELPSFLAPVETWMRAQEASAEAITVMLLADNDILSLLFNLIVIALAAGVTEEFFFRAALQRVIGGWTRNPHIIIWCAAILFSAFHLQFFGFLPRMLLGAYFGYLLYWTRNIWIPAFAHFTNNAVAVIILSDNRLKANEFITGEVTAPNLLPYALLAAAAFVLFIYCCRCIRQWMLTGDASSPQSHL